MLKQQLRLKKKLKRGQIFFKKFLKSDGFSHIWAYLGDKRK
jgi:hypothetical protein